MRVSQNLQTPSRNELLGLHHRRATPAPCRTVPRLRPRELHGSRHQDLTASRRSRVCRSKKLISIHPHDRYRLMGYVSRPPGIYRAPMLRSPLEVLRRSTLVLSYRTLRKSRGAHGVCGQPFKPRASGDLSCQLLWSPKKLDRTETGNRTGLVGSPTQWENCGLPYEKKSTQIVDLP